MSCEGIAQNKNVTLHCGSFGECVLNNLENSTDELVETSTTNVHSSRLECLCKEGWSQSLEFPFTQVQLENAENGVGEVIVTQLPCDLHVVTLKVLYAVAFVTSLLCILIYARFITRFKQFLRSLPLLFGFSLQVVFSIKRFVHIERGFGVDAGFTIMWPVSVWMFSTLGIIFIHRYIVYQDKLLIARSNWGVTSQKKTKKERKTKLMRNRKTQDGSQSTNKGEPVCSDNNVETLMPVKSSTLEEGLMQKSAMSLRTTKTTQGNVDSNLVRILGSRWLEAVMVFINICAVCILLTSGLIFDETDVEKLLLSRKLFKLSNFLGCLFSAYISLSSFVLLNLLIENTKFIAQPEERKKRSWVNQRSPKEMKTSPKRSFRSTTLSEEQSTGINGNSIFLRTAMRESLTKSLPLLRRLRNAMSIYGAISFIMVFLPLVSNEFFPFVKYEIPIWVIFTAMSVFTIIRTVSQLRGLGRKRG